ncbi:NAD(P)H-dependent oxidoreductase [Paenibacillus durus]|uniref:Flavodoxin-like fold domain-containing protein n=2 Tax=Paenibacillus durus TaxID=44251 RepID=A0A0F7CGY5_PAEDU|nr:NAD(P)H-dependent oxidoreductase [Paenibacillus durus]AKG33335.1 hypothetical protein VK70_00845 [Paenibacillus durus ATCC 35681]
MNVLLVYAHPEPKSFNGALKDLAVAFLTDEGHQVKVSDLYAMNFKAAADRDDFLMLENPDFFMYQFEQGKATKTNTFAWTPARDEDARIRYLEDYKKRLQNLSAILSIPYHPISHYDEHHQLKMEYR